MPKYEVIMAVSEGEEYLAIVEGDSEDDAAEWFMYDRHKYIPKHVVLNEYCRCYVREV